MQRPKAASGRPGRLEIIFEDRHIIAVEKPAGLPVIAAEGSRGRSLYDMVTAHIQRRNARGRAALVHRLDRDTSGIMIFATDARTKTALMAHWNEALTRRLYTALVEGCPPHEEGLLDSWLLESSPSRVLEVPAGSRGAQRALTRYRIIGKSEHFTLLELSLETGRRHQIRVQLASIGCPVAGDERYAAVSDPYQRLCLHASLLELQHPFANQLLCLESPVQPFAANTAERYNLAQKSRRS
ncbi:MAG: RluA family pseudouridine synthase [Spirochaetes bacterium]|nr:RluA family pseudouridine synthase [Spirochaetota bacterium]MBU0955684.1 RluA family pseudouridine synthase [Spirochaetota bacterium]